MPSFARSSSRSRSSHSFRCRGVNRSVCSSSRSMRRRRAATSRYTRCRSSRGWKWNRCGHENTQDRAGCTYRPFRLSSRSETTTVNDGGRNAEAQKETEVVIGGSPAASCAAGRFRRMQTRRCEPWLEAKYPNKRPTCLRRDLIVDVSKGDLTADGGKQQARLATFELCVDQMVAFATVAFNEIRRGHQNVLQQRLDGLIRMEFAPAVPMLRRRRKHFEYDRWVKENVFLLIRQFRGRAHNRSVGIKESGRSRNSHLHATREDFA